MTDIVNAFFHKHYPATLDQSKFEYSSMLGGMREYRDRSISTIFPRMTCADGFTMSVQGHRGAYSHPRDDFADQYSAVEIGFPSERVEEFMPFIDGGDSNPTETVYGYVPIAIVVAVIEKHGGLVEVK